MAVDLACGQADLGHDVWFVSAPGPYDDVLEQHGVHLQPVSESATLLGAASTLIGAIAFARRIRPDIVHAHMATTALMGAVVTRFARAVLVTTVHNSFKRHSSLMRLGRVIVAVSNADRALLIEQGFPARRLVTVLNGTIGSSRERVPDRQVETVVRPSVMTMCGLHERKAVDDVVRAFALLHAQFPDWHLNVVGQGPDREQLLELVLQLGLTDSVHFYGPTDSPLAFLRRSQIFATASLADPCPLGVMEARSVGCAVVGTAVGGIPEILAHGDAGRLAPPRDPQALADALQPLMNNPAELERWQEAALQGVEIFSVDRMVRDYDEVYLRATQRRRRAQSMSLSA